MLRLAVVLVLLADTTSAAGGFDPVTTALINTGVLGLVLALIVFDRLGTNSERNSLRIENKELRDTLKGQNDRMLSDVIPLISKNNEILTGAVDVLGDLTKRGAARGRAT